MTKNSYGKNIYIYSILYYYMFITHCLSFPIKLHFMKKKMEFCNYMFKDKTNLNFRFILSPEKFKNNNRCILQSIQYF